MHYPLIVIGAGAGGLVVAIGAAKAGKKVLLIEIGNYGGDCTNFGCIPSKSLIASAEVAHAIAERGRYGLSADVENFSANGALARARAIVKSIRKHEEPEALAQLGVETLTGTASFIHPHTLSVKKENGTTLEVTGDQIVIATGSSPFIPPVKGLQEVFYYTNETIFDLEEIPEHLAVLGGGPIGSELGQAFRRLGARVSIIQRAPHLMAKECLAVQEKMELLFQAEGIELYLGQQVNHVSCNGDKISIQTDQTEISCTHLLVSVGRRPNLEKLKLENAGIKLDNNRLKLDPCGRTSKRHIWALGDVAGRAIFTHVAENEARTVLTNLLIPGPFKTKIDAQQPIPRVTYTNPEVATVGLCQEEAEKLYGKSKVAVYTLPFSVVDRAITAGREEGMAIIVTKKWSSKILGASIVAPRAGEMLVQISTAMFAGLPLRKLAKLIHPYPTYSLVVRKLADMWFTKTLLPKLKTLIGKR